MSSDYLSDLLTHEEWDGIVWDQISNEIESGPYGEALKIFYEADGIAGADSYDIKPLVGPTTPSARASAYTDPNPNRSRALAKRAVEYAEYLDYDYKSSEEMVSMVRRGEIEAWMGELLKPCLALVCQTVASALDAIHSTSGALIVSSDSGSGTDALCATHTLLDGSTTWDNSLTGVITPDAVADMYETLASEVNANNVPTYAKGRIVWCGPGQRREMLQAVTSIVTSGAMQVNVNQGLQFAEISGLTSADWGMCDRPKPGGPTIAYAGGFSEAELPPVLRGLGIESTTGRPHLSYPIWDPKAKKLVVTFGVKFVVGSALRNGWIASTGV